jgi:hypothetical protein
VVAGTHPQFHLLVATPGHVGDVVRMDEYVGSQPAQMERDPCRGCPRTEDRVAAQEMGPASCLVADRLTDRDDGCFVQDIVEIG